MAFYFIVTNKDIILTEQDEEHYRKSNNCRLCEKSFESHRVKDHCHLTPVKIEVQHKTIVI